MKRKKLKSLKSLKAKLDKVFSEYVRDRDCLPNGVGTCITCGKQRHLQAGHFIRRQHLATRWEPDNVFGQCASCNCWGHGQEAEFYVALVKRLGQARVDELMRLKRTTVHFTRSDLEAMIERFSASPPQSN